MRGLLLKDWYMMKKTCRAYLLLIVVFLAASVWADDNAFLVFYPCVLTGMIPVTLLSYDERSGWDRYRGALPCTRAEFVTGKYLMGLLAQLSVLALTAAAQAARLRMIGAFSWGALVTRLAVVWSLALLAATLTLPLIFRFGVEKGRLAYYVVIGIICGGSVVVGLSGMALSAALPSGTLAGMVLAALGLYALSWRLSVALYEKREL